MYIDFRAQNIIWGGNYHYRKVGWNPTKNCGTFTWKAPQFLHFTSIEEGGSNTNVLIKREQSKFVCYAEREKRRTKSNVFVKPDEQSGSKCNTLTLCHGEKTKDEIQG